MTDYIPTPPIILPTSPVLIRPTKDLRLALARAVARPHDRAMLIDADNNADGWHSIEDAIAEDLCYCVEPRQFLLVLDVDAPWTREAADRICERLRHEGLRPVVLASGQLGRRHVFCVVTDRALLRELRDEAYRAGIDTRSRDGARIRPPFTRHRQGHAVTLLEPRTVEEAITALTYIDADLAMEPRLTQATWRLLRYGKPEANPSEMCFSIALGAAARGFPKEKLYQLLKDPMNAGGASIHRRIKERGEAKAYEYFSRYVWAKAQRQVDAHPTFEQPDDAVQALLGMRDEINEFAWRSLDLPATSYEKASRIGGPSMRKLVTFIVEFCKEKGTVTPFLGQHWLEEQVGLDRKTVARALRGLELLGWLKLVARGGGMRAHTYQLLVHRDRKNSPILNTGSMMCWGKQSVVGHDAFQRGGGIGDAGRRLLSVMSPSVGDTVKRLSGFAQVNESYARKVLRRMEDVGLVRHENRLWFSLDADLDQVANTVGTAGKAAARKAKNDVRRVRQERSLNEFKLKKQMERSVRKLRAGADDEKAPGIEALYTQARPHSSHAS